MQGAVQGLASRLAQAPEAHAAQKALEEERAARKALELQCEQQAMQLAAVEEARGSLDAQLAALQGQRGVKEALQAAEAQCGELQNSVSTLSQRLADKVCR